MESMESMIETGRNTHMLHGAGIFTLHDWAIFGVNVGIHIPAPWSIWDTMKYPGLWRRGHLRSRCELGNGGTHL